MVSDFELLEAWRGGENSAGEELLSRHFPALLRFYRNKLGDDIEDLVQRTLLACVEGRDRFGKRSSFRTYLFSIARNQYYDHLVARRREAAPLDTGVTAVRDLGLSPAGAIARKGEHRRLLEALRTIPIDDQIVLELYYWEDMNARDLGEVMGLPEPTVRTRLHRAKAKVRRCLEEPTEGTMLETTEADLERWARELARRHEI